MAFERFAELSIQAAEKLPEMTEVLAAWQSQLEAQKAPKTIEFPSRRRMKVVKVTARLPENAIELNATEAERGEALAKAAEALDGKGDYYTDEGIIRSVFERIGAGDLEGTKNYARKFNDVPEMGFSIVSEKTRSGRGSIFGSQGFRVSQLFNRRPLSRSRSILSRGSIHENYPGHG